MQWSVHAGFSQWRKRGKLRHLGWAVTEFHRTTESELHTPDQRGACRPANPRNTPLVPIQQALCTHSSFCAAEFAMVCNFMTARPFCAEPALQAQKALCRTFSHRLPGLRRPTVLPRPGHPGPPNMHKSGGAPNMGPFGAFGPTQNLPTMYACKAAGQQQQ